MWEAVYPFCMVPSENFDMLRLNYYDIFSPLVKVTSIRLLILLATSHHSSWLQFEPRMLFMVFLIKVVVMEQSYDMLLMSLV